MLGILRRKGKPAPKDETVCKKCGKTMQFLRDYEKIVSIMLPSRQAKFDKLNHQVVICEHCEQPYGFVKKKNKLELIVMTDKWIARQKKETRESIVKAIDQLKELIAQMKLYTEWNKRFTSE
jgi:hypothetical protein